MSQASPVAVGEVLADKYRIDRILGEGGMGVVVAAHHLELDQPVAIKFLLDNVATSAEGAERFRREARAAAKIQSDHVVRVLDVGVLPSGPRYMVMEYLDGQDLSEVLQASGRLEVEQALGYVLEALDAVGQAHASGIVHRDLKPANLFLARRADGSTRVKVLDFGISKSLDSSSTEQLSLTRTSAWMGSPLYMAPEQMQSARDVDGRADIWSVGAILYELISGQPPYLAESLPQLCNLLLTTDPAPLSTLRTDVPASVNDVVMRCLARPVTERWQNVPELKAALLQTGLWGGMRSSVPEAPRSSVPLAATRLAPTLGGAPSAGAMDDPTGDPAVSARTQAAWGLTGQGQDNPKRRIWLIAGGLGAAALVGLLFALTSTDAAPADDAEVADSADASLPQRAGAAAAAPPPAPGTSAQVDEGDPPATEPSAPKPAPPKPAPPKPAPLPTATPKTSAPSSKPSAATKPAPGPPRPPPTEDISDFGGRR